MIRLFRLAVLAFGLVMAGCGSDERSDKPDPIDPGGPPPGRKPLQELDNQCEVNGELYALSGGSHTWYGLLNTLSNQVIIELDAPDGTLISLDLRTEGNDCKISSGKEYTILPPQEELAIGMCRATCFAHGPEELLSGWVEVVVSQDTYTIRIEAVGTTDTLLLAYTGPLTYSNEETLYNQLEVENHSRRPLTEGSLIYHTQEEESHVELRGADATSVYLIFPATNYDIDEGDYTIIRMPYDDRPLEARHCYARYTAGTEGSELRSGEVSVRKVNGCHIIALDGVDAYRQEVRVAFDGVLE